MVMLVNGRSSSLKHLSFQVRPKLDDILSFALSPPFEGQPYSSPVISTGRLGVLQGYPMYYGPLRYHTSTPELTSGGAVPALRVLNYCEGFLLILNAQVDGAIDISIALLHVGTPRRLHEAGLWCFESRV